MKKTLLAFAALAAFAACGQPQQQTPEAPAVQLYALDCGRINVSDAGMFSDDGSLNGQSRDLVDPCFLIRHPDGDLLWDAGLPDGVADAPNATVVEGPFTLRVPTRLADQLTQLQLTPADIEFISFSHSHFDHVGNAGLFTTATWLVDADERAWMFRDEARAAEEFALIAPLENAPTRQLEGDGDTDVFGDGSVTIVQTPGHTPGHNVLLVRLPNAGPVLLTGDMWHMSESRERRLVPAFNVDRGQTLASMDKVEALAAETGARVVRQHVAEDFEALPVFPAALN
ncbi:MAG: N-acyl homoserine lactonase family protein [Hyphomonadaceae bacterium JAD_PAG50586_4]|nr:MAG: N-acyl homoserine lactonase family protein [Hyphomonadaceae bacterium JAD_PAG50586_4]